MIYLIKRDILKNINYKYNLFIIAIYLLYLIFQKILFPSYFTDILLLFSRNVGISYNTKHFLDVLIIILTNFLLSYNALSILISDLKCGKEQILLRISSCKFIFSKIMSINISTILINSLIYIVFSINFLFIGYNIFKLNLLILFFKDIIIKVIFQYIIIIIYSLVNYNISYLMCFILPLITLLKIEPLQLFFAYNNDNILCLLVLLMIVLISLYFVLKIKIMSVFERNEKNEI